MPREIRTSDRILFKRCRRKWHLTSPLRRNLTPRTDYHTPHPALWFGSGVHYSLEDFHGRQSFPSPFDAFLAYRQVTRDVWPQEEEELTILAKAILNNYVEWLRRFPTIETVWEEGHPLVEVEFNVPLWDDVIYAGTFDRIVQDEHGNRWILDYKTAAKFNTAKLELDAQCSAYCWAYRQLYGEDPEGVVYIQMLKTAPKPPRLLKNGHLSLDKQQQTTADLYRKGCIELYGSIAETPSEQREFLQWIDGEETTEGNRFIRRDVVRRTAAQINSEEWKVMTEAAEMLSDDLPLYPNPTRDCAYDCHFVGVCVAMDDDADPESIIQLGYMKQNERNPWRAKLP